MMAGVTLNTRMKPQAHVIHANKGQDSKYLVACTATHSRAVRYELFRIVAARARLRSQQVGGGMKHPEEGT
jgi:hypothetical protein